MSRYTNTCGTPACALGHYACRTGLQKTFKITRWGTNKGLIALRGTEGRKYIGVDSPHVFKHFGIDYDEANELFGGVGCGDAHTAIEAAEYIENFVAKRRVA